MSRRPLWLRRALAALACAGPLLSPPLAHADTCTGLSLAALTLRRRVGTTPNAVAVGDFNRDGQLDVAVANSGSNDVSILLGDGSGGFTTGLHRSAPAAREPRRHRGRRPRPRRHPGPGGGVRHSAQAQVLQGPARPAASTTPARPFPLIAVPTRIYLADFTATPTSTWSSSRRPGQRSCSTAASTGIAFSRRGPDEHRPLDCRSASASSPRAPRSLDFNRDGRLDLAGRHARTRTRSGRSTRATARRPEPGTLPRASAHGSERRGGRRRQPGRVAGPRDREQRQLDRIGAPQLRRHLALAAQPPLRWAAFPSASRSPTSTTTASSTSRPSTTRRRRASRPSRG